MRGRDNIRAARFFGGKRMAEVWKPKSMELLKHWIFESLYHGFDITDWERNFLVSIDKQLHNTRYLSQKQEETLERIYAEKTK